MYFFLTFCHHLIKRDINSMSKTNNSIYLIYSAIYCITHINKLNSFYGKPFFFFERKIKYSNSK